MQRFWRGYLHLRGYPERLLGAPATCFRDLRDVSRRFLHRLSNGSRNVLRESPLHVPIGVHN